MRQAIVLKAMMKRNFLFVWRYPFNLIAGLISLFLIFLVIFYGAQALGGGNLAFGATLSGIVMGFMLWSFIIFAYSDLTWDIINEAQQGTLEQLYMSPLGFGWVAISHILSFLLINLVITFGMLFGMMVVTGRWLNVDFVSVLPLMLLTVWAVYGLGFLMGGLALVFKQVQSAFQILQFVWIGLIAAPLDQFPLLKYAPVSWGTHLLGRVMIGGESIFDIPINDLLFLVLNSAFYFTLGFLGFKFFERVARDRGLLGHY
jgi:ABC-2 type transport system permease protein